MNKRDKKKQRGSKRQSNLSRVLSCSKNPETIRYRFFSSLTPADIYSSVPKVAKNPIFSFATNLTLNKNYTQVYSNLIPPTDIFRSFSWALGLVIYHKFELNKFIELEKQLSHFLLIEECDNALSILDEIDSICGISTWSIGIRGSILKLTGRYEESTAFMDKIQGLCGKNDFFKSLCRNLINKLDDSSMYLASSNAFRKQIIRMIHGDLQSFLVYKVVPQNFTSEYKIDYQDVFNYENTSSMVDIFKAIVNFISNNLLLSDEQTDFLIKNALIRLSENFSYYLFENFLAYFGISQRLKPDASDYILIDFYSSGNYQKVCEIAKTGSAKFVKFTIFEIIAKSAARTGENPYSGFKGKILGDLVNLFLKQEGYLRSLSNLHAVCHAFSGLPWFQELHFLISRESGLISEKLNTNLLLLSSIFSLVDSPRKVMLLHNSFGNGFFEEFDELLKDSLTFQLFDVIEKEDIEKFTSYFPQKLEEKRLQKYKAKLLVKIGYISEAILLLKRLVQSEDKIIAYEAMNDLLELYILENNVEKALELFVETSLTNLNAVVLFNTQKICEVSKGLVNSSKSINLPIAVSIHSRFIDSKYDSLLRFSFEKFLESINAKSPFELTQKIAQFGKEKVHYFLEFVCIPDIMKLSFIFENKKEIEDCRILVCNYLIDLNISRENLVNEVKQITKDQVIKKASTQVDQSRIYSDLSSFRDNRSNAYRTIFERFLELRKKDFSSHIDEITFSDLLKAFPQDLLWKGGHSVFVLDQSLNEKNATFHKLVAMLRDEFTFGDKGLNFYLSTRIRHGLLPNLIRANVLKEKLVTPLDAKTGLPKSNRYWHEMLDYLPIEVWDGIDSALKTFTQDFEAVIAEINDSWLQIVSLDQDLKNMQKGGTKSEALFNYTISTFETFFLQSLLAEDNYESFVKIATKWLWTRTELNLATIKKEISTKAKEKLSKCHTVLSGKINSATQHKRIVDGLQDAINRSKDSLHETLNNVSLWFTRSEVDSIKEFEFNTAIEIAMRSAQVEVKMPEKSVLFDGKHLTSFVDILYILFENAASKSNLTREKLNVIVELEIENEELVISVSNNCLLSKSVEESNKQLDYYREAYGDEDFLRKVVQKEGGSGIFKIWKTLAKDIEVKHSIEFGYLEDQKFVVKMNILNKEGVLILADSNS